MAWHLCAGVHIVQIQRNEINLKENVKYTLWQVFGNLVTIYVVENVTRRRKSFLSFGKANVE